MHAQHHTLFARIAVAVALLLAMLPGVSGVVAQSDATSYTDEEFGITFGWTDDWIAELPTEESPVLVMERDSSITLLISVFDGELVSPEDAVWFLYEDDDEVIEDRSTEVPASLVISDPTTRLTYTSEAHAVNDGAVTVLISMATIPVLQDSAIGIVQGEITVNGSAIFTGEPLGTGSVAATPQADATAESVERSDRISRGNTGADESPEATAEADPTEEAGTQVSRTSRSGNDPAETPEATEEATTETSRTSRTGNDPVETPDATEEPTTEITRTSRTGSGDVETPEATEVPTEDPTETPTEEPVTQGGDGEYTGTVWGYSFTYDTSIWELSNTYDNPTVDGIRLDGEFATVAFVGTGDYGADPVGCLLGEEEYFGTESDSISNWEVATDANGDQLWYESDELAWGVFSYTFHSSSGTDVEFVDYISCETIPGEDAVLIVQMTSFPDEYNNNLDAVLDILDTIEFEP